MKKRKLPKFTAEKSISKTAGDYNRRVTLALQQGIIPQISYGVWGNPCIPDCVCIGPDDCPCCSASRSPLIGNQWHLLLNRNLF